MQVLCLLNLCGQVGQIVGIPTETPAAALGGNEEVKPFGVCLVYGRLRKHQMVCVDSVTAMTTSEHGAFECVVKPVCLCV